MTSWQKSGGQACGAGRSCPAVVGVPFPFVLVLVLLLAGAVDSVGGRSTEAAAGAPMLQALTQVEVARERARSAIEAGGGARAEQAVARLAQAWTGFDAGDGRALARLPGEAERRAEIGHLVSVAQTAVRTDPRRADELLEQLGSRLHDLQKRYGERAAEPGR